MNHRIALMTSELSNEDERIYGLLGKSLCAEGWRVEIINPRFEGTDPDKIRFRRVALPSLRALRMLKAHELMLEALLESRADVAVLHDAQLLLMLPKAKRQMPIQVIFDASCIYGQSRRAEPAGFAQRIADRVIAGAKLDLCDAFIASDGDEAGELMRRFKKEAVAVGETGGCREFFELCDELERRGRYNI